MIKFNFPDTDAKLVLVGTIQFASSLYAAKQELIGFYPNISVPQARPLSPGTLAHKFAHSQVKFWVVRLLNSESVML